MKYFIIPLITLFSLLTLTGCEPYDGGRYVDSAQLTGLPWTEGWYDDYDEYVKHTIRFDSGNGYESFVSPSYRNEYFFNWDWVDDVTLILYYDNGDILYFDIYELTPFRLYGLLGNDRVDFSL